MNHSQDQIIEQKNVLILSYGPVPTPEYQTIEGGGMRCWGLAEGLLANGHKVTVAVNSGFPQSVREYAGIALSNWRLDESFVEYINSFDAVVVSYCMGDLSVFVADNISPQVTLVLDGYVPFYVEVSARNAEDLSTQYRNYFDDVQRCNHALRRGDYFLCANTNQKHMYMGVLGSLGVINPRSYAEDRIIEVPFGISEPLDHASLPDRSPYEQLGIKPGTFVLLWFGGLYPWFDFTPLLAAIETMSSEHDDFAFVLVGGKNPFNANPEFVAQFEFVHSELTTRGMLDRSCYMVDWVDFDERSSWYGGADAVISLNRAGEENVYSWRTRVMDYVWGGLPMLTNGGDPLSDYLLSESAAIKITTDTSNIKNAIELLMTDRKKLANIQSNLAVLQRAFLWPRVTAGLARRIVEMSTPFDQEQRYAISIGFSQTKLESVMSSPQPNNLSTKLRRYYRRAREKGVRRSLAFGLGIVRAKALHILRPPLPNKPRAIFLSHPIDDTGAPLVLLDVASDFGAHFSANRIHIAAPRAENHLLQKINQLGFTYHKIAEGVGDRIINLQLNIQPNDFVMMNTVAIHENYKQYIYRLLEHSHLNRAYWFIHEDKPELRLQNMGEVSRIIELMRQDKLRIVVPSQQTAAEYNEFLGVDLVRALTLRVTMPEKFVHKREPADFQTLRFMISGTPSDGRKGQLLFLAALELARTKYAVKAARYRKFEIHFISIGDDYISEQIKAVGEGSFGKSFHHYPRMPREEALVITEGCNVAVCTSLNETFAIFVAEGMMMGHVALRNRTSGWQEQMQDGVNGYLFDTLDINDLAEKLELLLNIDKTSNHRLAEMGSASHKIAQKFQNADYYKQIISE